MGRPKSERDLANEPGHTGRLSVYRVGGHLVASLQSDGNSRPDGRALPDLHQATLVGLGGERMVLRGFQRVGVDEASPAFLQEWNVLILGQTPAA
jgi:hypothetical protein